MKKRATRDDRVPEPEVDVGDENRDGREQQQRGEHRDAGTAGISGSVGHASPHPIR